MGVMCASNVIFVKNPHLFQPPFWVSPGLCAFLDTVTITLGGTISTELGGLVPGCLTLHEKAINNSCQQLKGPVTLRFQGNTMYQGHWSWGSWTMGPTFQERTRNGESTPQQRAREAKLSDRIWMLLRHSKTSSMQDPMAGCKTAALCLPTRKK